MHFTYQEPGENLCQGDILEISPKMQAILSEIHPYYAKHPDYSYLIVLSQTCDLERRHGSCKARYITLAAVRPLQTLLNRELETRRRSSIEINNNICSSRHRIGLNNILNKLYNNNLPKYFFLAEDPSINIKEPHVAFLTLSIPIKAKEHYQKCIDARIAQLSQVFQAKLGWLVGDIYSRVATPDWVPTQTNKEDFNKLIDEVLDRHSLWLDDHLLSKLIAEQKK